MLRNNLLLFLLLMVLVIIVLVIVAGANDVHLRFDHDVKDRAFWSLLGGVLGYLLGRGTT